MFSTLKQSNKLLLNVLDPRFCSKPFVSHGSAMTTTYLSQRDDRGKVQMTFSRGMAGRSYNVPPSDEFVATVSGIATMCSLPYLETAEGLDAAFVGVPIDTGTSNRPGTRFGPRQIRAESALLLPFNSGTRAAPYESLVVADIGDVNVNVYDLKDTCKRIREAFHKILATGCIPLTMGGDHTIAYPILQAVAAKHGPVGLIHVDAHADTSDVVLGEKIGHGTPFRRCVEEGLLDCKRVIQIGLRGTGYSPDAYEWSRAQGFRVVQAEECWHKSLVPLMAEVHAQVGSGPVYISFDIDALDPAYAPGTGTPEIAGLTPIQALEIIRGCRGLNLVGCDLVEVSPPYDTTEITHKTNALATLDRASLSKLGDWLLCQSAFVLLKGRGPSGSSVEADLQKCFLSNIDLEDLRTAIGFLMYGRELNSAITL